MSLILKIFNIKFIIVFSILLAAVLIPIFIFFSRDPVLIVAEDTFPDFYGRERLEKESFISSLVLFRPVKNVIVANEAGDDIVSLAVNEVSKNPLCVLFPLRFAGAAKLYREQNPHIRTVLLEGRFAEEANPSSYGLGDDIAAAPNEVSRYFTYKTDVTDEFRRAGLTAAAIHYFYEPENRRLDRTKPADIAVFLEKDFPQVKETFSKAFTDFEEANRKQIKKFRKQMDREREKREKALEKKDKPVERKDKPVERKGERGTSHPSEYKETVKTEETPPDKENKGSIEENISALKETEKEKTSESEEETVLLPNIQFYASFSQYTDKPQLTCVVLADTAVEYFDKNNNIPIIYFSWFDPQFIPKDVVVIVNDSPWIQAVQAVRMVLAGEEKGLILSKIFLSKSKKFDKRTLRKIKKIW